MNMANLNWVDFTILGILTFSTLISLVRGFMQEAVSLATWILAIWVAYKYGHTFGENVMTMVHSAQAKYILGALALFFIVLIFGAIVNFVMSRFLFFTGLSAIDRILGIAFGFARGVLLVAVLILVGEIVQLDKNNWWRESQITPQFAGLKDWLRSFVPEQVEKIKEEGGTHTPVAAPPEEPTLVPLLPKATMEKMKQGVLQDIVDSVSTPAVPATDTSKNGASHK